MQRNCERGDVLMTKNEQELLNIIRTSEDKHKAMVTAVEIICHYIAQHGSSQVPPAVDRQESA